MVSGSWLALRRGCWSGLGLALPLIAVALCATPAVAKPPSEIAAQEYQVKAAYLFRFLSFINTSGTPNGSTASNVCAIAIIGQDPFGSSFLPVEGRAVPGRDVVVRIDRFSKAPQPKDLDLCLIAYICSSEKGRVAEHLKACAARPVLTVSDMDGFLEAGGMLQLVESGNRLRWEINRAALDAAGLVLNSQLLRNAVRVIGKAP
jgi:hypothetical protein